MLKWFAAQELAGLPGLPGTERAIQIRAKREGWEGQRRLGSKALEYSFAVLPAETQAALLARLVQQEEPQQAPQPTTPHALITPKRDGISASRLVAKPTKTVEREPTAQAKPERKVPPALLDARTLAARRTAQAARKRSASATTMR